MTGGGEGVSGHIRSLVWRQQSRERKIHSSRGYDQYTIDGKFVQRFHTLDDLRFEYPKIDTGALSLCVNNKTRSTYGYRWTWLGECLRPWFKVRKPSTNPHNGKNFRPVLQYTKSGNYINTYPSLIAAAQTIGKHPNTILECCKGRSKTAGGFVWKYSN